MLKNSEKSNKISTLQRKIDLLQQLQLLQEEEEGPVKDSEKIYNILLQNVMKKYLIEYMRLIPLKDRIELLKVFDE
jgi:hypothetical protein